MDNEGSEKGIIDKLYGLVGTDIEEIELIFNILKEESEKV